MSVNETLAKGSKVFNPWTSLFLALVKTSLTEGVFAARAASIWDLTMLTMGSCGIHNDWLTVGSPTRTSVTVWLDASSANVINWVKLTDPVGANGISDCT